MIRELEDMNEDMNEVQVTVVTLGGEVFAKRDTTSCPFGEHDRVVAFWDDAGLVTVPMSQVKSVTLHFDNKRKKHFEQIKEWIRNHVPFQYRTPLEV